ncbi:MAG TPA: Calx-beta domain-containing protein, partial [Tepidisphaeraceae bacterium]|nr:Calx-beta domain-containing protein [Tepidisphaeraceae bacterium]
MFVPSSPAPLRRPRLRTVAPIEAGPRPPALAEPLEPRRLFATTTIGVGSGDGSLSVTVDAYGAYGSATPAGNAFYDPIGAVGSSGTTYESAVYLSTLDAYLAEGSLGTPEGGAALPGATFTSTSGTSATSTFTIGTLEFTLVQTVLAATSSTQTTLRQTYTIKNVGTAPASFDLVRHVDGDMSFKPGLQDYAGATANRRFVFEFDTADDPAASSGYFGLTRAGDGTYLGYAVQPFRYTDEIAGANGIPIQDLNRVNGDVNGDRLSDTAYDVTISQHDRFASVPVGATVTYTTNTLFGEGSPLDLLNPGEFVLGSDVTVDEDAGSATVTIERVAGSGGVATVDYAVVAGTATENSDYTPVAGTATFSNGQTSTTFTIPILNDNVMETLETFGVTLSNVTGGADLGSRISSTVTIVDEDGAVQFASASLTVRESDGAAEVTVVRVGSVRDPITVNYATADGTATGGADYTPVSGTLSFAAGQRSATFDVPVAASDGDDHEPTETILLSLSGVAGPSVSLGSPSTATLNLVNVDVVPPQVADVATRVDRRGRIGSLRVAFNEPMHAKKVARPSSFTIWDRGIDGRNGRGDDKSLKIRRVRWNKADNSATIVPRSALRPDRVYQLSVNGLAPDTSGNRLDADGNGAPND